jgi:hypothetical protein
MGSPRSPTLTKLLAWYVGRADSVFHVSDPHSIAFLACDCNIRSPWYPAVSNTYDALIDILGSMEAAFQMPPSTEVGPECTEQLRLDM